MNFHFAIFTGMQSNGLFAARYAHSCGRYFLLQSHVENKLTAVVAMWRENPVGLSDLCELCLKRIATFRSVTAVSARKLIT